MRQRIAWWGLIIGLVVVGPWGSADPEVEHGWNQWGGQHRDGSAPDADVFGDTVVLKELWRSEVDEGISALVVRGDRLFSLASVDLEDHLFALDASTGKELWRVPMGTRERDLTFGAASTVATDGEWVYALSPGCTLSARSVADGKARWSHDLKAKYETGAMKSGCWTSPLLADGLVVVQVNGEPDKRVVAFDKATGEERWSSAGTERSVRSSPAMAKFGGIPQVVVHERNRQGLGGLYGLGLEDGALLWTLRLEGAESYGYDTPLVIEDDRLAVVTWNDLRLVEVHSQEGKLTAKAGWASQDIRSEVQPYNFHAVYHQGHLYGFGGDFLMCLDVATGEVKWSEKIYPGSLIIADGHLVVLSQAAGLVRVVEASPKAYHEKFQLEVFNPGAPTDTPPTLANGRIYLRNSEEMVALEINAGD